MIDLLCLWIGRVILLSGGLAAAVWIIQQPIEYAWRQLRADAAFMAVFHEWAKKRKEKR